MALTKVSYSMINGEPLNVLDYGAVGNSNIETGGGTDDTAAILLATADAIATGRTLFAPSGYCFRITDQINMIGVEELQWQGLIYADNITTKPAVRIGGWSNGGSRKKFFINEVLPPYCAYLPVIANLRLKRCYCRIPCLPIY